MSTNVTVQRIREIESLPRPLSEEMESISQKIRKRAHEIFLMRGGAPGSELDDWLQAERQIMWLPQTEMRETEREFQARINVQGLEAGDLRVIALPDLILLQAEPKSRESMLFLRLDFSTPINLDKVTAKLEHGMLQVIAPKVRADKALAAGTQAART
jgi:HSP20 family molecular chaperone IbpA